VYQLTVGTVCYSLVAEISTRRLQIKTVVLGRALYIVIGIISSVLTPYMINPSAWDWGNYAGLVSPPPSVRIIDTHTDNLPQFWAGSCFLCIIYTYFRIPEPRGRTFAELDLLFERGVSARKFATTEVDVFDEEVDESIISRYKTDIAAQHSEHTYAAENKRASGN
jgi:SP family general alpha glucoside:H+ symporter-like MFS transporter